MRCSLGPPLTTLRPLIRLGGLCRGLMASDACLDLDSLKSGVLYPRAIAVLIVGVRGAVASAVTVLIVGVTVSIVGAIIASVVGVTVSVVGVFISLVVFTGEW